MNLKIGNYIMLNRIDTEETGPAIDFERSIDDIIGLLQSYRNEGWTNICKYGDEWESWYYVCKYRPETDEEYNDRLKEREQEVENRRALYEDLKKEFGDT
jgi:hypothetical protein